MSDLAARAVDRWHSAAELFGRPSAAYRTLRFQLRDRVAGGAEFGIAFQDDEPVVVLLHSERLTVGRPADPTSEHSPIEFESISLAAPSRVRLAVSEVQRPEGNFRRRTWTFGEPGPSAIALENRAHTSQLAAEIGGEALVAEAAARLGFPGRGG